MPAGSAATPARAASAPCVSGKKILPPGPYVACTIGRRGIPGRLAENGRFTSVIESLGRCRRRSTRRSSYHVLFDIECWRRKPPFPRVTTSSLPSGAHAGWRYSPATFVSRTGSPPDARTFQRWPSFSSSKVVNAIHCPSGDHAGDSSTAVNDAGRDARRCAVRHVGDPELPGALERRALSVRRPRRPAEILHLERVVANRSRRDRLLGDRPVHARRERDLVDAARRHVEAADLAALRDDDALAVRASTRTPAARATPSRPRPCRPRSGPSPRARCRSRGRAARAPCAVRTPVP